MSKVLIIEPHRMLQQAFVLTMSSEDEVCAMNKIEDSGVGNLGDFDLVIVDAAALREVNALNPEVTRALQAADVPALWLEEGEPAQTPMRDNLIVLRKPVEREAFHNALTKLLKPQAGAEDPRGSAEAGADKKRDAKTQKSGTTSSQESFEFIDLTDVVKEATQAKQSEQQGKKS